MHLNVTPSQQYPKIIVSASTSSQVVLTIMAKLSQMKNCFKINIFSKIQIIQYMDQKLQLMKARETIILQPRTLSCMSSKQPLNSWQLFVCTQTRLVPKFFGFCPLHRIFGRMHGTLNIDEKKLIAQFGKKSRDETFEPNQSIIRH